MLLYKFNFKSILCSKIKQNEAIKCFALIASNLTEMYHKAGETFIVDKSFVDVKAKQASLKETAGILNA